MIVFKFTISEKDGELDLKVAWDVDDHVKNCNASDIELRFAARLKNHFQAAIAVFEPQIHGFGKTPEEATMRADISQDIGEAGR